MHHEVGFERLLLPPYPRVDKEAISVALDGLDLRLQADLDADRLGRLQQHGDEIGVELLKRAGAPMQDLNMSAGTSGDVGELEGDVAAADEAACEGAAR